MTDINEEIIEDFPEPTRTYIKPGELTPIGTPLSKKQAIVLRKQRRKLAKRMGPADPTLSKYQLAALTRLQRLRPDQQEKIRKLKQQIIEQTIAEEQARIAPMLAAKKPVTAMPITWQVPIELRKSRDTLSAIERGDISGMHMDSLKPHMNFLRQELLRSEGLMVSYRKYIMKKYSISEKAVDTFLPDSKADRMLGKEIADRYFNLIRTIRYGIYRPITIASTEYGEAAIEGEPEITVKVRKGVTFIPMPITTLEEERQFAETPFKTRG